MAEGRQNEAPRYGEPFHRWQPTTPAACRQNEAWGFDGLAEEIHSWARSKGFYDREQIVVRDPVLGDVEGRVENPCAPAEKLMLIVSECSEVLEALRNGDRENEAEEVADIVIRVLDYAGWRGISLDREIAAKIEKNRMRPHLHGRQF